MAEIAHVAYISEGKVVIEASLAYPVTNSLLNFLSRGSVGLGWAASFLLTRFFWLVVITCCLNFLQETLLLSLGSLSWWHSQVLWHTFAIIKGFRLLASVAFLSSFEVIVLALAAFPSAIWELEVIVWLGLLNGFLWNEWLDAVQVEGLMEWFDTACRSGHLSKLIHLVDGWHLSLNLELLKRWEVKLLSHGWEELLGSVSVLLEGLVWVALMMRGNGWWHILWKIKTLEVLCKCVNGWGHLIVVLWLVNELHQILVKLLLLLWSVGHLALGNLFLAIIFKEVHREEWCLLRGWNDLWSDFSLFFHLKIFTRLWWSIRSGVGFWNVGLGLFELCLWWSHEKSWLEPGSFVQWLDLLSLWLSLCNQLLLHLKKFEELVLVDHDHVICGQILLNQIIFDRNLILIYLGWERLLGFLLVLEDRLAVALSHWSWDLGLGILVLVSEHFFGIWKLSRTWIIVWKLDKLILLKFWLDSAYKSSNFNSKVRWFNHLRTPSFKLL